MLYLITLSIRLNVFLLDLIRVFPHYSSISIAITNPFWDLEPILSQVQWIKQSFYDELKEAAEVLRHNTILKELVMFTEVKPDDECNILQSSFDDAQAARRMARQLGWSVLTKRNC